MFFILWIVQWARNVILHQVHTMFLKHILHCHCRGKREWLKLVCFVVYWARLQPGMMVIWKMPSILFCAARVQLFFLNMAHECNSKVTCPSLFVVSSPRVNIQLEVYCWQYNFRGKLLITEKQSVHEVKVNILQLKYYLLLL